MKQMTRLGLVLGAGGTVGLAWHAGVLRALEHAGIVPDAADVIIGTSAGSVAAAYMRSGWTTEELWQVALGKYFHDVPSVLAHITKNLLVSGVFGFKHQR